MNKKKIINDPVYGFVKIPYKIIFDLVEHPYFQRLRRIQQLGLTSYVYPGALHTRFHHALGATHLMIQAIDVLRSKGVKISKAEAKAATIAILLHDIGHGPFSHALEHSIVTNVAHETLSILFMKRLNELFAGKLTLAIQIFEGIHPKKFLHELVSSQLDMDRLDYLTRDSFFTGVQEGVVGFDRIIKMLHVKNNKLVVEIKGIYSIEKFIIARRLMYWQVYLHKTVLSAEMMLLKIMRRAKELAQMGRYLFATAPLAFFLQNDFSFTDFQNDSSILEQFAQLDDLDVFISIKVWQTHEDFALSDLAKRIVHRRLFRTKWSNEPFKTSILEKFYSRFLQLYPNSQEVIHYFIFTDKLTNSAYMQTDNPINILYKNGKTKNIAQASDQLNIEALSQPVTKYFLCYPKELDENND